MDESPTIIASWIPYFVSAMTTLKVASASTSLLEAMQRPQDSSIAWFTSGLRRILPAPATPRLHFDAPSKKNMCYTRELFQLENSSFHSLIFHLASLDSLEEMT